MTYVRTPWQGEGGELSWTVLVHTRSTVRALLHCMPHSAQSVSRSDVCTHMGTVRGVRCVDSAVGCIRICLYVARCSLKCPYTVSVHMYVRT